jgi:hypothetical protein
MAGEEKPKKSGRKRKDKVAFTPEKAESKVAEVKIVPDTMCLEVSVPSPIIFVL